MNDVETNVPIIRKPRKLKSVKQAASKPAVVEVKMFPVILNNNYMPLDMSGRLMAGSEVALPIDEAKRLIAKGIASRNDPIG